LLDWTSRRVNFQAVPDDFGVYPRHVCRRLSKHINIFK
jgi:hypothetical protein